MIVRHLIDLAKKKPICNSFISVYTPLTRLYANTGSSVGVLPQSVLLCTTAGPSLTHYNKGASKVASPFPIETVDGHQICFHATVSLREDRTQKKPPLLNIHNKFPSLSLWSFGSLELKISDTAPTEIYDDHLHVDSVILISRLLTPILLRGWCNSIWRWLGHHFHQHVLGYI